MKIMSFNIRGLGSRVKKTEVNNSIRSHKIDICCLQKTKLENLNEQICRETWGTKNFGWASRNSVERAGGMVIIWNSEKFSCLSWMGQ